ncbi:AraC family transcriptional regulator [Flavobacterium sp. xlx-214]|uniref:helix-turn-helix domain-containing protein n=1 Tax=unclassified Flavobacterium TaxID=196869 RepID=UPI0013D2A4ED|nr:MULTISPECIES: helix-turn-helix domain-containing protein [unclassified Flavobacterium]MBA5794089.1 AraC family transcriptional regulator [Flavobacterium sp. xlx-221]QMI83998.1 AraC family transcriptional regulator [Flavobacterium sp. xlx-214]
METIYIQLLNYGFILILLLSLLVNSTLRNVFFTKNSLMMCGIVTALYALTVLNATFHAIALVILVAVVVRTLIVKWHVMIEMEYLPLNILLLSVTTLFLVVVNQYVASLFVLSFTAALVTILLLLLFVHYKIQSKDNQVFGQIFSETQDEVVFCNETDKKLENILASIYKQFEDTKCYLNSAYTIDQLEKDLKICRKDISLALNKVAGQNFYQFIAYHRVTYAKEMILADNRFTLETLSLECGFYSKSTFNKYFKKFEGQTPSRFKLSHS